MAGVRDQSAYEWDKPIRLTLDYELRTRLMLLCEINDLDVNEAMECLINEAWNAYHANKDTRLHQPDNLVPL